MNELDRTMKLVAQVAIDAGVAACALALAFLLRFDGVVPPEALRLMGILLPAVAVGKTLVNYLLGNYRQIWQYTGLHEARRLALSGLTTTLVLVLLRAGAVVALPYSVIVLDGILYLVGLAGARVLRRLQVDLGKGHARMHEAEPAAVHTLFVGAGDTANALLRSLKQANRDHWKLVGLLDDSPAKQGMELGGYPVLGPTTQLEQVMDRHRVQHVVVAMPSASSGVIRDLISRAQNRGATVQVVPRMRDLIKNNPPPNGAAPVPRPVITIADLADSAEVKKTLLNRLDRQEREQTVLITGGAGYIGSLLVRKLLDQGYAVRVLDNFTFGYKSLHPLMHHPGLEIVHGDISSIRDVVSSVKDVGSVVALAAIVGDPACGLNAEETLNLNYESTKVLVEACNFYGVGRLLFASSCSVYGASDNNLLTETSPLNPISLYARTRILSENVIFDRCGDVVPVVLRLSTVFGLSPRMRYDLVVNALTARALLEGKFQIFGGNQQRPFIHCQDAAEAFLQAVIAPVERVRGEVFNVGSNHMNYTISEVGQIVADEVGGVEVQVLDDVDDLRNYRVSFDKIQSVLGFTPCRDVPFGVRELIHAIETTPDLREYDDPLFSNVKIMQDRLRLGDEARPNGHALPGDSLILPMDARAQSD